MNVMPPTFDEKQTTPIEEFDEEVKRVNDINLGIATLKLTEG